MNLVIAACKRRKVRCCLFRSGTFNGKRLCVPRVSEKNRFAETGSEFQVGWKSGRVWWCAREMSECRELLKLFILRFGTFITIWQRRICSHTKKQEGTWGGSRQRSALEGNHRPADRQAAFLFQVLPTAAAPVTMLPTSRPNSFHF